MQEILKPGTLDQLRDAIAWAVSEQRPLDIGGAGTKAALGRPERPDTALTVAAMKGIDFYEPEELVLSAAAGTPVSEVLGALGEKRQMLAFEPPDLSALLGVEDGRDKATLGGMVATNFAGPRRVKSGAVRDHLLGFSGVSGRGEIFKSGGRVVKNVTGYDLSKIVSGSYGTLAVLSSVTLKVLPAAECEATLAVGGVDAATSVKAMSLALNSPNEVSGAAWLPASPVGRSDCGAVRAVGGDAVFIRIEGFGPSVEARFKALEAVLSGFGPVARLDGDDSAGLWASIRDVKPFAGQGDSRVVWRISTAPTNGPALLDSLMGLKGAEGFFDWGGGLIWFAVDAPKVGGESILRDAVAKFGGHATLIRGSADLRGSIPVFQPQQDGLAALTKRIKQGFDPSGVLNPGRMYEGV